MRNTTLRALHVLIHLVLTQPNTEIGFTNLQILMTKLKVKERLIILPMVTQLLSSENAIQTQATMFQSLHLTTILIGDVLKDKLQ